jgi:hypothetical protein
MAEWAVDNEPPVMMFDDVEALVDAAKAWAATNMTSLFKKRSDSRKVVLLCSHGDKYISSKKQETDQKRNSSTIKTNCQF